MRSREYGGALEILFLWFDIGHGHRPSFNLGLAFLSSIAKQKGHNADCIRLTKNADFVEIDHYFSKKTPVLICFSLMSNQREYLDEYAQYIQNQHGGLLIAGGVHATLAPQDILACEAINGVCVGEAEGPFAYLLDRLERKEDYWDTPSFTWRMKNETTGEEKLVANPVGDFESDLAQLPRPDYSIFDVEQVLTYLEGYFSVVMSRGCPHNCTYCCNHVIKEVYPQQIGYFRILPVTQAVDFLVDLKKQYPHIRGFIFEDDLLFWKRKWFIEFAKEYSARVGMPYVCQAHFQSMNGEIIDSLKDSGCQLVQFGLESGDEEMRMTLLGRRCSDEKIKRVCRLLHEKKMPFFTYNITGFPNESKAQMDKTLALNQLIRPHSGTSFYYYPYPGTKLHELCKKRDILDFEKMKSVSGYKEKPVILMTNCTEKECIQAQRALSLYLAARSAAFMLNIDSPRFDMILYHFLLLFPSFFTYIFDRENLIRKLMRKVQLTIWNYKNTQ